MRILAKPIIISSTFMCRMISVSLAVLQPAIRRAMSAARHIDIGQHARVILRWQRHRFLRDFQVQRMRGDEDIQRVKVVALDAIHFADAAVRDGQAGCGIVGAVGDDQAGFGPGLDVSLFVDVALRQQVESFRAFHL